MASLVRPGTLAATDSHMETDRLPETWEAIKSTLLVCCDVTEGLSQSHLQHAASSSISEPQDPPPFLIPALPQVPQECCPARVPSVIDSVMPAMGGGEQQGQTNKDTLCQE